MMNEIKLEKVRVTFPLDDFLHCFIEHDGDYVYLGYDGKVARVMSRPRPDCGPDPGTVSRCRQQQCYKIFYENGRDPEEVIVFCNVDRISDEAEQLNRRAQKLSRVAGRLAREGMTQVVFYGQSVCLLRPPEDKEQGSQGDT